MSRSNDITLMKRALELARHGWGNTHPNPMVGAVIAEKGEIVAEGFHLQSGGLHAEVNALSHFKGCASSKTTLYVTLEPCSTKGRTPPCTETIIQSGIKRVVLGALDPNPKHRGRGIQILREAGIEVEVGILGGECEDLNLIFNHWIAYRAPLVAGKVATTLDGHTATRTGHSQWITGSEARRDVMRWRRLFPAIAVGAGTVLGDNPRLTSRLEKEEWCPLRFIFDIQLRTVCDSWPEVYCDNFKERTVVVTSDNAEAERMDRLTGVGVEVWQFAGEKDGTFFAAFRQQCVKAGITGIFCEGGANLLSSLLASKHLDYLFCYRAPKFLADEKARPVFSGQKSLSMHKAFCLARVRDAVFEDDQLMRGFVVYP